MGLREQNPRLTIGISTVRRAGQPDDPGYLSRTVSSLLASMSGAECARVEIIIVNSNSPPEAHAEVEQVLMRHAGHVPHLLRSVAKATASVQPTDSSIRASIAAWERKLSLDFVNTLRFCRDTGSEYVLRLEDDVIAAEHFVNYLMRWCESHYTPDKPWAFLSLFSPDLGPPHRLWHYYSYSQALLFPNNRRLDDIIRYVEDHYPRAPVDLLLADYRDRDGRRGWVKAPSLFQHIGDVSSGQETRQLISPMFTPSCSPVRLAVRQAAIMCRYLPSGLRNWLAARKLAL